jgi:hypothetical protein
MRPFNPRPTTTLVVAGLIGGIVLALTSSGCSGFARYSDDRVRDLSDIVDIRYGTGFGLGVTVQFTDSLQTGIGCSPEWYQRQWFGRKSVEVRDGLFAGALIIGFDGDYLRRLGPGEWRAKGDATTGSCNVLILTMHQGPDQGGTGSEAWFTEAGGNLPSLSTGRIGGAVFLPGVNGGLYLNFGEMLDFLLGLTTYDLMNDDGYPKFFTPGPDAPGARAASAEQARQHPMSVQQADAAGVVVALSVKPAPGGGVWLHARASGADTQQCLAAADQLLQATAQAADAAVAR